jgi:hypothetical protein
VPCYPRAYGCNAGGFESTIVVFSTIKKETMVMDGEPTMQNLLERLARLERERDDAQGLRRRAARGWRRFGAAVVVALLVALVPLSLLAANPFGDLNPNSVHNDNIDAIYNAGITTGCDPNVAYCPNAFVTREEMASFLARTAGLGQNKAVANAARLSTSPALVGSPTYAANDLARAANLFIGDEQTLVAAPQNYRFAPLTIQASAAGFVVVTASVTFRHVSGTCPCSVHADIVHTQLTTSSNNQWATLDASSGSYTNIGMTQVFPVNAGPNTFFIKVDQASGAGVTSAFRGEMTGIFVPFGASGGFSLP